MKNTEKLIEQFRNEIVRTGRLLLLYGDKQAHGCVDGEAITYELSDMLKSFENFLRVKLRRKIRAERTIQRHLYYGREFLEFCGGVITKAKVDEYLKMHGDSDFKLAARVKTLRRLLRDFLGRGDLIADVEQPDDTRPADVELPTKEQLRRAFQALESDEEKALFLFFASTGLRPCEVLGRADVPPLRIKDVDFGLRMVKPRHQTRTKKAGITFYNPECEKYLMKYLKARGWPTLPPDTPLFTIGSKRYRRMWRKASEAAGTKITPKILRKWFATQMQLNGVSENIIKIFTGHAPTNVLAQHYTTPKQLELKQVYDRANLKILS